MRIPRLAALLVGAFCFAGPLVAQDHDNPYLRPVSDDPAGTRRGPYYASLGVGLGGEGIASLGAPGPYTSSRIRPTVNLALGATIGQQLRLGFEGFAWFNVTGDGALETVTAAMLGARVYPLSASGLYLRAAGGFGRYGQDVLDDYCNCTTPIASDFGFAWSVGGIAGPFLAGYIFDASKSYSLAFLVAGLLLVIGVLVVYFFGSHRKRLES